MQHWSLVLKISILNLELLPTRVKGPVCRPPASAIW